jgi:predicted TIM-barrel fold metal-dependent hydrolase
MHRGAGAETRIGDVTALIDTHVHHWDLDRFRYPWMDDPAFDDLRKDYVPADYRADAAGAAVEGWVHIQAEVDHRLDPVAETEWVRSLAEEARGSSAPGPLACVVCADLGAADVRDVLSRHCRYPLNPRSSTRGLVRSRLDQGGHPA